MERYRTAEEREARRDLAVLYRDIRRDNPAMARLLQSRLKEAVFVLKPEWLDGILDYDIKHDGVPQNGNGVQAGAP
jgi:hypothetical protein